MGVYDVATYAATYASNVYSIPNVSNNTESDKYSAYDDGTYRRMPNRSVPPVTIDTNDSDNSDTEYEIITTGNNLNHIEEQKKLAKIHRQNELVILREPISNENKYIFDMLVELIEELFDNYDNDDVANKEYGDMLEILYTSIKDETTNLNLSVKTSLADINLKLLEEFTWVTTMDISNVALDELPKLPPNIVTLNASNNYITAIAVGVLPKSLTEVDLSKNYIKDSGDLSLPDSITKLNLHDNRISEINWTNLPISLIELDLSNNLIEKLSDLSYFDSLTDLHLDHNSIDKIDPKYLPPNVELLDLSENNFKGQFTVKDYPKSINVLHVSDNQITYIDCLDKLENLGTLDVSNNMLKSPPTLPKNLIALYISDNPISYINSLPQKLQILDISNCNIQSIYHLFTDMYSLQILKAKNNMIRSLPNIVSPLKKLYLSDNEISFSFDLPPTLEILNLANNKLKTLDIKNLKGLKRLKIQGNNIPLPMIDDIIKANPDLDIKYLSDESKTDDYWSKLTSGNRLGNGNYSTYYSSNYSTGYSYKPRGDDYIVIKPERKIEL